MSSITYWNRIEPRPRSDNMLEALAARIRDPLWFLTRQWQLGEFLGEDAASPACVTVESTSLPILGWRTPGGPIQPLDLNRPLEAQAEIDPFYYDLTLSVELGQIFESLVSEFASSTLIPGLRHDYPLVLPAGADEHTKLYYGLYAGRVVDGASIYFLIQGNTLPALGLDAAIPPFLEWVKDLFGRLNHNKPVQNPPTWNASTLSYDLEVIAAKKDGTTQVLAGQPNDLGELDWTSFDALSSETTEPRSTPLPIASESPLTLLPMHVRYRGMPAPRWWDFENGKMDFGNMTPDRVDLGRLIFMDFMLIHGADWFMIPFKQKVGTLSEISSLTVYDVFGDSTQIKRTEDLTLPRGSLWTMFSTSVTGDPNKVASYRVLPPTAAIAAQEGEDLEQVRFFRDEMADMAWAVEHTIPDLLGKPRPGHQVDLESKPPGSPDGASQTPAAPIGRPPVQYNIETSVPSNWFPLLPKLVDSATGEFVLQRGVIAQDSQNLIEPKGRILTQNQVYQIREQEVPREGTRVSRTLFRSRWIDGSTHLWVARKRTVGQGEGASGLKFDQAVPNV